MNKRDLILKECLDVAESTNYNGIFLLPTGSGKGRFMIEVAKRINPDSITYLCDNTNLRDEMFRKELHKWGAGHLEDRTTFACYQSAYKWDSHTTGLALYDEFDAALTQEYSRTFSVIKSPANIYTSATLSPDKRKMAEEISTIVYEQTFSDFVERGILNQVKYFIVNYSLTQRENEKYLKMNKEFRALLNESPRDNKKLNYLKIKRKQFLSSTSNGAKAARWIADSTLSQDGNTLIFCGLTQQADLISPYSYHSKSSDSSIIDRFNSGEVPELAVVEKITRGVNLNNVKWIIHETIGTSNTKLVQKTGRGMRLKENETLTVFFLVPYFRHPFHGRKPTVVLDWVKEATKNMNFNNVKTIEYL